MRAVRHTERGIEVCDVAEPSGDGVDVQVQASAICGSDLHMLSYGPLPFTLGHELAGLLDDGTPVAIDPTAPCGECDQCLVGERHLCRTGAERVLGIGTDGGMAETIRVQPSALVYLPDGVGVADACLVEPLGVAAHGLRIAGLTAGARVAVVGAGSIGLAAVAAAHPLAGEVGLSARHPAQIAAGERLGARDAHGEYDLVVEAAGTESALARAAELCRPGGMIVFLSTHWTPVTIPGIPVLMKELGFQWSYTYGTYDGRRDLDDAAALLLADPEIAPTIVTHRGRDRSVPRRDRSHSRRDQGGARAVIDLL